MQALSKGLKHSPLVPTSVALCNVLHPVERCVLTVIENETSNNYRWLLLFRYLLRALEVATWRYMIKGRSGRFLVSEQGPSFLWHVRFHPAKLLHFSTCEANKSPSLKGRALILVAPQRFSVEYSLHIDTKYHQTWNISLHFLSRFTKNENYIVKLPYVENAINFCIKQFWIWYLE
jgi:hypothetical protein